MVFQAKFSLIELRALFVKILDELHLAFTRTGMLLTKRTRTKPLRHADIDGHFRKSRKACCQSSMARMSVRLWRKLEIS